jgi:hypothetical protein
MKKIISLVVLISSIVFAQTNPTSSLVELKQRSAIGSKEFEIAKIQNSESSVLPKDERRKSAALAIFYSMLLPGMGELYAGAYDSGKYFTIADGVLWGTFAGFELYGKWKADDYKSFAHSNGGVSLDGKDADYFANIGLYLNSDNYNTEMDRQGSFDKVYNSSSFYWKWASNDQRKEYRGMWSSSENAYNNVRFVVGALVLNRIISAINAVRLVSAYNKNLPVETSWNVSFGVDNRPTLPTSFTVNFVKEF